MKKNNVINVSRQSVLSLLGLILFWFPSSGICQQDKQKQMNPAREIERAEYENSRADRVEIAQIDGRDYYKYYLSPESLKRKFGPSVNLDKYKGYYLQEIPADIDLLADDLRNDPLIDSVDVLGQSSIKVYITEFNFLLKNPSIQLNPEDGQFPGHYLYLIAPNAPYLPIYPSYSSQGTEIAKHRTPYSRSFVNNGSFRTFLSLRPTSYPANGEWIDLPPDEPIPNSVREILETRSNHWSTYYATSIEVNNDGFNAYNYVFNGFENYYLTIGAGQSPGVLNHHHFQRHSTQFDLSSIPDNAEITSVVLDHYLASYYPDERDVCSDCIYDYEEIYPYINSMSHDPIDEYESSGGAWDTRNNSLYNPAWDGSLYYSGSGYIWDRDDGFNEPASFNNAGVSAVQSSLTSDVFSIGIVDYAENDEDPSYWEGVVRAPYYDMLIIDGNGLSAPNPPNNVSASIDDYCDKVRISWNDESGDEDGFRILRDGSEIHETNSNVEYYDDESAAPGVLYEYCVLAFNDVGDSDQDCENGRKNDKPDEPDNVQATGGTYCDRVVVTWDDNSNNEAGFHIYRDGSSINSVQANQESYTDYDAIDGVTHDYCVRAYNDCDESDNQDCDEGWLKTPPGNPSNCSATDGTYPDKVRVDWNTVSEATGYRIYRDGNPIGTDTSPPYDDIGATDCHDYSVVAYNTCGDSPGTSNSDQGSLSGKIQGYVHIGATTNAVQGVSISVRYNSELVGAATSNSDGYYEVSNLPLNRNYEVDPSLQGHEFSPDPANNVRPTCDQIIVQQDFEDISSFSAGGTVTFSGTNCRASNIPIFVDGDDLGIVTDGEGNWSTAVLIGEHCFTSEDPFGWSYLENPICVDIIDNNENLNFTISTNRLLELSLLAGCDAFISDATFLIWEKGETWESSCASWEILSELQSVSISLPPMEYYISYSYNGFSPETPIEVDLRQTDQSAEFRYLTPLYIEILDLPIDADCNIPVIHRGEEHQIRIRAFELVNNVECYVDGVTFSILNLVADEDEWHNYVLGEEEYELVYSLIGGEPHISPDYTKLLEIHVSKDGYEPASNEIEQEWVLVTGDKIIGDYLTTVSPEILFWIVHNPNGDGSYSYVQTEESFLTGSKVFLEAEFGIGYDFHAMIPVGGPIVVNIEGGLDLSIGAGLSGELLCEITATEEFSTSGLPYPELIGPPGDIYVVTALNIVYGSTQRVALNDQCEVIVSDEISYYPESFASTNILTDYYITNHTIPACPDVDCIEAWNSILDANAIHDNTLTPDELLSLVPIDTIFYSGGIDYNQVLISSISTVKEITGWIQLDAEVAAGVGIIGDPIGANVNVHSSMQIGAVSLESQTNSTETGVHLSDDDQDDSFGIALFKDLTFGTVLPEMLEGSRSSCPLEENTSIIQLIETQIVDSNIHQDVLIGEEVQWTLRISNPGGAEYAVPYLFTIAKASTLCNSEVNIDGNPLVNASYTHPVPLDPGEYVDLSITAEFGISNTCLCDTLLFTIKPSCEIAEHTIWEPEEITVSVCWESDCPIPNIVSSSPAVVNSVMCEAECEVDFFVNTLDGTYEDVSKIYLEKNIGVGWHAIDSITAPISPPNPNWLLSFEIDSGLSDGLHEFRAHTICSDLTNSYSESVSIQVDRTGPEVIVSNPSYEESIDAPSNEEPLWCIFNEGMNPDGFTASIWRNSGTEPIIDCIPNYSADEQKLSLYTEHNEMWLNLVPNVVYNLAVLGMDIFGNVIDISIPFYVNSGASIPVSICFNPFPYEEVTIPPSSTIKAIASVDLRQSVEYLTSFQFKVTWDSELLEFSEALCYEPFSDGGIYSLTSDGLGFDTLTVGSSQPQNSQNPFSIIADIAELNFLTIGDIGELGELVMIWDELRGLNGVNLISQITTVRLKNSKLCWTCPCPFNSFHV